MRVLVVDDQLGVRTTLIMALQSAGFDVVAAENGAAALKEFASSRFDVAIIDVYMPGVDGVKLIKTFRERRSDFPIVAMSGVLLGDSERTALDFIVSMPGMSNVTCLKKPFRMPELLTALRTAVEMAA
ncbi:MAG TPA: response regulator [Pseudorhodoplanes sp.]|jgi:DNA-binding response OmpR family regulator|nr:response regulator [Pseudorhodoplanes sp.]